jgi:pimeloyl-ACP methyl ester carboxylesterase
VQPPGLHVVHHHAGAPGPQVVIVHGAPDRSKNFAHVVHQLHDLNVSVYDRRGYGKSLAAAAPPNDGFGFAEHADDLLALLDGARSVVVGQSAGATIAMLAATRAPELFAALGAWEPPMVAWDWWLGPDAMELTMSWAHHDDPAQLGEEFNRGILGDERWDALRPSTQEMLRAEGTAFRADMACQDRPLFDLDDLKQVPMILGYGTVSPSERSIEAHREVARRAGAEPFEVEGADHFAHTNHPDAWVALVRRTVALAERAAAQN